MKGNKPQIPSKSTSMLLYNSPSFSSQQIFPISFKPPELEQMNDRQLLKQHFYLSKFIKTLESNNSVPTLPNQQLLIAIKKQNQSMQQKCESFRNGTYQQYLIRKFNAINKQIQIFNSEMQKYSNTTPNTPNFSTAKQIYQNGSPSAQSNNKGATQKNMYMRQGSY